MAHDVEEPVEERKGLLRAAWRHHQFRYLLSSYVISGSGDFIYTVALIAYVYDKTGSPGWVSAAAVVRILPYVVFGTLGGAVAAWFDRRLVMIVSDMTRAAVMVAMAVSAAADAPSAVLIARSFVNTTATTPWAPSATAVTPDVVGEDDLAAANAVEATANQISWFLGPGIGAVLFALTSATASFAVNGLTFVVSALLISRVTAASSRGSKPRTDEAATSASDGLARPKRSIVQIFRDTRGLVLLTGMMAAVLFGYGYECVMYPLIADQRLGIGAEGAGYMIGAIGIGGLLVAPFTGRLAASRRAGSALAVASVLLGLPLILLSVVTTPALAVALVMLEGVGTIVFEVVLITMLQRMVRGDDLARVYGFQSAASTAAMLVGSLIAPIIVNATTLEWAVVIGGSVLVAYGVLAARSLGALGTRLSEEPVALKPFLAVFDRLHIFDGASQASLERIASSVVVEHRQPGDVVLRQGDQPDDFYIVNDGTLEVSKDGLPPEAEIGAGEWFGEIGLLRGVPRNATVTVRTAAELWRIDGQTFGEAIAGLGSAPAVMEYEMLRRVARTIPSTERR